MVLLGPWVARCGPHRGTPRSRGRVHVFLAVTGAVVLLAVASVFVSPALAMTSTTATSTATPAAAPPPTLVLETGAPLSDQGQPVPVLVSGEASGTWPAATLAVTVAGPGAPSTGGKGWPQTARVDQAMGDLQGAYSRTLPLPATAFPAPGAYMVTATLTAQGHQPAVATLWLGRLTPGGPGADLAMLFPVALGIHRDPEGVFMDDTVRRATVPDSGAPGSLYGLLGAADRYPAWHMTLGVEPVLLSQISDMTDGYASVGPQGRTVEIPGGSEGAKAAQDTLDVFRQVATRDGVQIIPGPYALPPLSLLARFDWSDGFDQMRLGKSVVQSELELSGEVAGAFAPGLDITTDSIRYLSEASIDYTVVKAEVAKDLTEPHDDLSQPVRVRDTESNRLTLLFSDAELQRSLTREWDPYRFLAAVASRLAAGERGPFVVAPEDEYELVTGQFMDVVGAALVSHPSLRTRTLQEIVDLTSPSSRPVFLTRYGTPMTGYVAQTFVDRLRQAHVVATDFLNAADSERSPADEVRLLLYTGESRYWFVRGADPAIANLGFSYLIAVDRLVREEFDKVDVADKSVIVVGKDGDVPAAIVNQAGYPLKVTLVNKGDGLRVRSGATADVTLGPQENIVSFPVTVAGATGTLTLRVQAGTTLVDEGTVTVRSISFGTLLPWILLALGLVAAILLLVLRVRPARRRD